MIKPFVTDKIISLVDERLSTSKPADDEFISGIVSEISTKKNLGCTLEKWNRDDKEYAAKYYPRENKICYDQESISRYKRTSYINILYVLNLAIHELTHAYIEKYKLDDPIANQIRQIYEEQEKIIVDTIIKRMNDNTTFTIEVIEEILTANHQLDEIEAAIENYYLWNIEERVAHYIAYETTYIVTKELIPSELDILSTFLPLFDLESYKGTFNEKEISISPSIEFLNKCGFTNETNTSFPKYYDNRLEFFRSLREELSLRDRVVYGLPIKESEFNKIECILAYTLKRVPHK